MVLPEKEHEHLPDSRYPPRFREDPEAVSSNGGQTHPLAQTRRRPHGLEWERMVR